jgi:hypothetical protein
MVNCIPAVAANGRNSSRARDYVQEAPAPGQPGRAGIMLHRPGRGRKIIHEQSSQTGEWIMQTTKQITVFLENKPGRLANVLAALANEKVNIIALSVMDKHEHSVLRLVTDEPAKMTRIIQTINTPFTEAEVLMMELRNQPGSLSHVCEILAAEHINIDYAYCSSGGRNGKVIGVFKLSNTEKAIRVLAESPNVSSRRLEKRVLRDQRAYAPRGNNRR